MRDVQVGRYVFREPLTIKEALYTKRQLEAEVSDISFQLADPQRRDSEGEVYTPDRYKAWKRGARAARLQREAHIKFLKDWVREARLNAKRSGLGVGDRDRDLLIRVHDVLKDALEDNDFLDMAPQALVDLTDLIEVHMREV